MTRREFIRDNICVGLRKGCASKESSRLYSALNPLFNNGDLNIQQMGYAFVNALATDAAGADDTPHGLSVAFKNAASNFDFSPVDSTVELTHDNQGFECLKSMLPLFKYDDWKLDLYTWKDRDTTICEQSLHDGTFEPRGMLRKDECWIASAVILKLAEEIPAVREKFEQFLVSMVDLKLTELKSAAQSMTDDCWACLASYIHYNLEDHVDGI